MQLILVKDVPNVGIANEIVKVKDGYARNYLLPQNLAVIATQGNLKERAKKIEAAKERKQVRMGEAQELADRMNRIQVTFERKSSEEGRLFGSVTKEEIVEALAELHHIEVDRRLIHLPHALKTVGETLVKVKLEQGISAQLSVVIETDQEIQAKIDAAEAAEEVATEEVVEEQEEAAE